MFLHLELPCATRAAVLPSKKEARKKRKPSPIPAEGFDVSQTPKLGAGLFSSTLSITQTRPYRNLDIEGMENNPTNKAPSTKVNTTPTITAIIVTPKAPNQPVLK